MKTLTKFKYLELADPDVLHEETLQCISELNFLQDELRILKDLTEKHSLELMFGTSPDESQALFQKLIEDRETLTDLIEDFESHNEHLQDFIEESKQPEKLKRYQDNHKKLIKAENEFQIHIKTTKKEIFQLLSVLMKRGKQKKLMQ